MALVLKNLNSFHSHNASTLAIDEAPGNSIISISECTHYHYANSCLPVMQPIPVQGAYHLHIASNLDKVARYWTDMSPASRGSWSEIGNPSYGYAGFGQYAWSDFSSYAAYCSNSRFGFFRWNDLPDIQDWDILALFRFDAEEDYSAFTISARVDYALEDVLCVGLDSINNQLDFVRGTYPRTVDTTVSTIATAINTGYWMRYRGWGKRRQARVWAQGSPEPATWDLDWVDEVGTELAGDTGFGRYYSGITEYAYLDYFHVASGMGNVAHMGVGAFNIYHEHYAPNLTLSLNIYDLVVASCYHEHNAIFTCVDNFNGSNGDPPNPRYWESMYAWGGTLKEYSIQNNKLRFSASGANDEGVGMRHRIKPEADFMIELDYEVVQIDQPMSSVQYAACLGLIAGNYIRAGRSRSISINGFFKDGTSDAWGSHTNTQSPDSGTLRLKRANTDELTVWYWDQINQQLEWDGSSTGFTFTTSVSSTSAQIDVATKKEANETLIVDITRFRFIYGAGDMVLYQDVNLAVADCYHEHVPDEDLQLTPLTLAVADTYHEQDNNLKDLRRTHITDFSEYSLGTPGDWTERWHVEAATPVITAGGEFSDNLLLLDYDTDQRYMLSWDDVGTAEDVEILYLCEPQGNDTMRLAIRGSGTSTSETAYSIYCLSTDNIYLGYYNNGSWSQLDSASKAISAYIKYWVRFRVKGSLLQAKVWQYGTAEPEAWDLEATDSTIQGAGWVAAGLWSNDSEIHWFGVEVGGETVEFPWYIRDAYHQIVDDGPLPATQVYPDDAYHIVEDTFSDLALRWRTDFSEYTTGLQPSDWTERWATTGTWEVVEGDGTYSFYGGKAVEFSAAGTAYWLLTWDVTNPRNVEILFRILTAGNPSYFNPWFRPTVRASGGVGSQYAYQTHTDGLGDDYQMGRLVNGAWTYIGTEQAFNFEQEVWTYCKFRVEDNALKIKIWNHSQPEPAAWSDETTDSNIDVAGWVGIHIHEDGAGAESYVDLFYIATGGLSIPTLLQVNSCYHLNVVTPTDLTIVQTGTSISLTMTDGGAYHLHVPESIIIDPAWVYPADLYHLHTTSDPVWFVQQAYHEHVVTPTNLTLTTATILGVAGAYHDVYSPELPATQVYPNDCYHLNVVTPTDLDVSMIFNLVMSDAGVNYHPIFTNVDNSPIDLEITIVPDDCNHVTFSPNVHLGGVAPSLRPDNAVHQVWSQVPYLMTDTQTFSWGYDFCTGAGARSRIAHRSGSAGHSPNMSGKVIYAVKFYLYEWHSDTYTPVEARIAIYQLGQGEAFPGDNKPHDADLIVDIGKIAATNVEGYRSKTCTKTFLRKNAPTWLGHKGDYGDWHFESDYNVGSDYTVGAFLDSEGSTDPDVAWEDPWGENNGSYNAKWSDAAYIEIEAESATQLLVNDGIHLHTAQDFVVGYFFFVDAEDCYHLQIAANVVIDPAWANAHDAYHLHVNVHSIWWLQSAYHVLYDDGPIKLALSVSDAYHIHYADEIHLVVHLEVANTAHTQVAENVALSQDHDLANLDCYHEHFAGSITLAEWEMLSLEDCYHIQAAGVADLTQLHILGLDTCYHLHVLPPPLAITQEHSLALQNAFHLQDVPSLTLSQDHTLIVDSVANLHFSGEPYIVVHLDIQSCAHEMYSDELALTQEHTLVVAGTYHLHIADNVAIVVPITVEDVFHEVTSDSLLLTANHFLAVIGTYHVHVVTGLLVLFQLHFLEVAGTGQNTSYNYFDVWSTEIDFGYLPAGLYGSTLTIIKWVNQ